MVLHSKQLRRRRTSAPPGIGYLSARDALLDRRTGGRPWYWNTPPSRVRVLREQEVDGTSQDHPGYVASSSRSRPGFSFPEPRVLFEGGRFTYRTWGVSDGEIVAPLRPRSRTGRTTKNNTTKKSVLHIITTRTDT